MEIEIKVSSRAKKQRQLLEKIAIDYCQIEDDKVMLTGLYDESKRVIDVNRYVVDIKYGVVKVSNAASKKIGAYYDAPAKDRHHSSIVLVIESPHELEYNNGKPIGPAQGTTGARIERHLKSILERYCKNGELSGKYSLIICNPVQFQASLHSLHGQSLSSSGAGALRDKVWKAIIEHEAESYIERLRSYDPVMIINACTSKLKPIVRAYLIENFNRAAILYESSSHPCFWNSSTTLTRKNKS